MFKDRDEILKEIEYWNKVSSSRNAVLLREVYRRDRKKRIICPLCNEHYLVSVYLKFRPGNKWPTPKWVKIGKFCPHCRQFFLYEELLPQGVDHLKFKKELQIKAFKFWTRKLKFSAEKCVQTCDFCILGFIRHICRKYYLFSWVTRGLEGD